MAIPETFLKRRSLGTISDQLIFLIFLYSDWQADNQRITSGSLIVPLPNHRNLKSIFD